METILKRSVLSAIFGHLSGLLLPDLNRLVAEYALSTGWNFPYMKLMDGFVRLVRSNTFDDWTLGKWMDGIQNGNWRSPLKSAADALDGEVVTGQDGRPYTRCEGVFHTWRLHRETHLKLCGVYEEAVENMQISVLPFAWNNGAIYLHFENNTTLGMWIRRLRFQDTGVITLTDRHVQSTQAVTSDGWWPILQLVKRNRASG